MAPITQTLADFIVGTRFEDLPASVVEDGWRSVADTLAVGWAGAAHPSSQAIQDLLVRQGGSPDARAWGFGDRLPSTSAAFANSVFAAALDFDSLNETAVTHSDLITVPVALALCERERRSGMEFLTAMLIGNEVLDRLARSTRAHKGWFYTSLHGVFSSTAVASRILGLDRQTTCHALGIAMSQAGGTQQPIIERTLMKRVQGALAAQAGVFSALLAQSGITAPREPFEGKFGIFALYEPGDANVILDGLGRTFAGSRMGFKKYPSCACTHAAIQAALSIADELNVPADGIAKVDVRITPYMARLVGGEFVIGGDPQVAAQFSVQYTVACALLRRRFTIDDIAEHAVRDPEIAGLAKRVNVVVDPASDGLLGPAEVSVLTRDGRRATRRVEQVSGSAALPLTRDELAQKFSSCMDAAGPRARGIDAGAFFARIERVAECRDMSKFFSFYL